MINENVMNLKFKLSCTEGELVKRYNPGGYNLDNRNDLIIIRPSNNPVGSLIKSLVAAPH